MEITYNSVGVLGIIIFPEWVFNNNPTPREDIKENIFLIGTNSNTNISIIGNVDD